MHRMLLLCGPAFAGKTTLARGLVEALDAHLVSLDAINEERGVGYGGDGLLAEVWQQTLEFALDRLADFMASGRDVVIDDTSCYRWLRDAYREIARRRGYRDTVILLDTPVAEIERRRRANRLSGGRRDLRDEVFAQHMESFEYPEPDEPTVVFRPDHRPELWIADHLGDG